MPRLLNAFAENAPPLVVGAATFACFSPILANGFVNFDDPVSILENAHIRELSPAFLGWAFSTVHVAIFQPLTWVTYAVGYALWELDATGYHLTSLVFHTANAVLMYFFIRQLLRRLPGARPGHGTETWAAVGGALFFSLHPLRVEPVAWISAVGQVQAAIFTLLTLLAYLRAQRHSDRSRRHLWIAASAGCFLVSMLSNTHPIALPLALLVIDHFALRRFRTESWRAVLVEKLPFFAVSAGSFVLGLLAKSLAGAFAMTAQVPHGVPERLLQAGYVPFFYAAKTLVPAGLSPLYPFEGQIAERAAIFYATAFMSVATALALVLLYRRWPALLGAWLAYVALLLHVLGFTQYGPQIAADRYTYHSCMPWAVLLAFGLQRSPARTRRALAVSVAVALAVLGGLTAYQTRIWKDGIALWGHAVALDPESALVRLFWANTLREEGEFEPAVAEYARALELGVHRPADAYNGRAASYHALGRRDEALADANEAVRLAPHDASFLLNRGLIRGESDLPRALADWSAALRLDPELAPAYHNRGIAREALGDRAGAIADYERALAIGLAESERADARQRLARLRPGRH